MANEQNLVNFTSEQSREEAAKNGAKGGRKRAENARRRKTMQQLFRDIMELPLKPGEGIAEITALADVKGANITTEQAIAFAQVQKAMGGDTSAAAFIRDTMGEKPVERVDISPDIARATAELEAIVAELDGEDAT